MNQSSSSSFQVAICLNIEDVLWGWFNQIVLHIHLVLLGSTLAAVGVLIWQYVQNRVALHGNLLLLFANIILLYFMHTLAWFSCFLRYRILLFLYHDPCQLLTPIWMVFCFYGPYYLFAMAYPAFHFCVMIERLRATIMARKYEQEGQRLGWKMAAINWIIGFIYLFWIIYTCLLDTDNFSHPQGLIFMTSNNNASFILFMNVFFISLVIFTAFCDWRITVINKRLQSKRKLTRRNPVEYSLSRNYQLNENVLTMTMQLILPLDVFYACFYSLHIASVIVIRSFRLQLSNRDYVFYYYLADTLLYIHTFVTIIVYIRFMKYLRRKKKLNLKQEDQDQGKIYFNQLKAQWDNIQ